MLIDRIDAFLRARRMAPTRFGREAVGDSKFVLQLRDGREPRAKTVRKVTEYLDRHERAAGEARPRRSTKL
jgi:hypothetical protein